jgi:hypothetical protein
MSGASVSRSAIDCELTHSFRRATSGFGRYRHTLWKRISPRAHTVSKVYSSPSMYSSTETSGTWRVRSSARSNSSASRAVYVSAEPAPAIGLMIIGIADALDRRARSAAVLRARVLAACARRRVRARFFIDSLSR